jgi:hypothetical protein
VTFRAAAIRRAREYADRRLSRHELAEMEAVPIEPGEREAVLALVRWFCRRYPTPAERLAYVRRAYARWRARQHGPR